MKRIICKVSIVVAMLIFAGCGSGIPEGTDSDVKDLVMDISKGEIQRQITPALYAQVTGIPVGLIGLQVTYEDLKNNIDEDDNSEVVDLIDSFMDEMSLTLSNIRTKQIQEDIKKSTSSADLTVNDKVSKITYTAQHNADGDLYVEVFGLK